MSPTMPTTTDPPDSWIRLGPSSFPPSTSDALSNLVRVDQSTRQHCKDGVKGSKIADAYGRPLGMHNGEENNGNCWLLTHQSVSPLLLNESWQSQDYPMTTETAEFWIHQLRSVLHETRTNLNLIVAFHHRQMQKIQPSSSDLNTKPSDMIMQSKSVAVQTSNDNDKKMGSVNESKLNYYRKSVATPHSHCSIIPASPAVTSKQKTSNISLHGCRCPNNSCCSPSAHCCYHGTRKRSNRYIVSSPRPDARKSHDRQWNKNIDTTILLLNDAWQLAGLHTRQRMSILSRHYRILYQKHQRLQKKHRNLHRSMIRTRHQTRYVQHQLQILLGSIVSQVDDVASDWVDRLKGLLDNDKADGSPKDYSYSPVDFTARSSLAAKGSDRRGLKSSPTSNSFSLYRWYSSLSLKLSWIQTSHRNVIDNILLHISQDV